jgi:uncharacterized protein (TIGR02145 family)
MSNRFYQIFACMLSLVLCVSCRDDDKPSVTIETGTLTDIDNNIYKTVKIGSKWWMAENLKVKRFKNGQLIPNLDLTNDWVNTTQPALCSYDNTINNTGILYNYYAVSDTQGLAPAGWHVATENEWKELETYIGMPATELEKVNWRGTTEGDLLKIEGPAGWTKFENIWGANKYGFTALAGGCRLFNGYWSAPGLFGMGFWWTSTETNGQAWYRYLDYKKSGIFRYYGQKNYGMNVRCVKD